MKYEARKQLLIRSKYLDPLKRSKVAQELLEFFIKPLLNIPEFANVDLKQRLNIIFGADHRHILTAIAEEDFLLPGFLIYGTVIESPRKEQCIVNKGDKMFVRIDDRTPNRIDIELLKQPDVVFILTKRQYYSIVSRLKGLKKCPISLKKPFMD